MRVDGRSCECTTTVLLVGADREGCVAEPLACDGEVTPGAASAARLGVEEEEDAALAAGEGASSSSYVSRNGAGRWTSKSPVARSCAVTKLQPSPTPSCVSCPPGGGGVVSMLSCLAGAAGGAPRVGQLGWGCGHARQPCTPPGGSRAWWWCASQRRTVRMLRGEEGTSLTGALRVCAGVQ